MAYPGFRQRVLSFVANCLGVPCRPLFIELSGEAGPHVHLSSCHPWAIARHRFPICQPHELILRKQGVLVNLLKFPWCDPTASQSGSRML